MTKLFYINIYRKRLTFALALTILGSVFYVFYQIVVFRQITESETSYGRMEPPALGVDPKLGHLYQRNGDSVFRCVTSGEPIGFERVNDDYCDCPDGSDEPGTNACPDGVFHCSYREQFGTYPREIPSSRVNDRVCDCCDGSDEWKRLGVVGMKGVRLTRRFKSGGCPELCSVRSEVKVL